MKDFIFLNSTAAVVSKNVLPPRIPHDMSYLIPVFSHTSIRQADIETQYISLCVSVKCSGYGFETGSNLVSTTCLF